MPLSAFQVLLQFFYSLHHNRFTLCIFPGITVLPISVSFSYVTSNLISLYSFWFIFCYTRFCLFEHCILYLVHLPECYFCHGMPVRSSIKFLCKNYTFYLGLWLCATCPISCICLKSMTNTRKHLVLHVSLSSLVLMLSSFLSLKSQSIFNTSLSCSNIVFMGNIYVSFMWFLIRIDSSFPYSRN